MISWAPLLEEHKPLIDSHFNNLAIKISDLTFTTLWMWKPTRRYQVAVVDKFLCLKFDIEGRSKFLMPMGEGSSQLVVAALKDDAIKTNSKFVIQAITEDKVEDIISHLNPPWECLIEEKRSDFLYSYQDLSRLAGNKFQAKRNLIYQFEREYPGFIYKKLDQSLIPKVTEMQKIWFERHKDADQDLKDEHEGILHVLSNFDFLKIVGGVLLVDEKVVAYTFGEVIGQDTLLVHVEKALTDYRGAYQLINQQFLMHMEKPVIYVNREEDLGNSHLHRTKESYHPVAFLKKYCVQ